MRSNVDVCIYIGEGRLTSDWNSDGLILVIQQGDVHIGGKVSSFETWCKVCVPSNK